MPSPANLFGLIVFSVTGFAMFSYARKQGKWRSAEIGVALMAYPYFVYQTWELYAVGLSLFVALFIFRDCARALSRASAALVRVTRKLDMSHAA